MPKMNKKYSFVYCSMLDCFDWKNSWVALTGRRITLFIQQDALHPAELSWAFSPLSYLLEIALITNEISICNRPERAVYFNKRHRLGLKYYIKLMRPVRTTLFWGDHLEKQNVQHTKIKLTLTFPFGYYKLKTKYYI